MGRLRYILTALIALAMWLAATAPALSDFQDGVAAYNRGNYATALREIQPLAERGLSAAQFYLGLMYANGTGVTRDYTEAVKWHRKAAEQGYAKAQYGLGSMYYIGQGVTQNYAEAYFWYSLSAAQGNKGAATWRDIAENKLNATQLAKLQRRTNEWRPRKSRSR